MMSRDAHFYLTLPSNASTDIFPDNKTTGYRIKLPETINLEGDWEVGVYSIIYPNSWYTIADDNDDRNMYFGFPPHGFATSIGFDYGYYEDAGKFIEKANKIMKLDKNLKGGVQFKENNLTKKITVEIKSGYSMTFNKRVSRILGFESSTPVFKKTTVSPYGADMSVLSTIYVYCDIVEPQVVGDVSAQLLRSIPVQGKFGDIISETFVNIQYAPMLRKSFEDVEILLRGDTGDPVPFERGKVVVTLHFRKHTYFT